MGSISVSDGEHVREHGGNPYKPRNQGIDGYRDKRRFDKSRLEWRNRGLGHERIVRASRRLQGAFTLIELLIVCACLAIALQITAAPFAGAIADARSATAMRHLSSLFSYARQEAILRGTPVTVCALTPADSCSRDWLKDHRIVVFVDTDEDRRLAPHEQVLRQLRWPMRNGELSWRASLARRYIEFENNGATWQNGTLYYCPRTRDARFARALVISHSGRGYLTIDSNGDGLREDRLGRNLSC